MAETLPVSGEALRLIKRGYDQAVAGVEADLFWQAWPSLKEAIDALPDLRLWRHLPEEFRWTLVAQMQICGIPLPQEFLRKNQWLLDLKTDGKGKMLYEYGFDIERRKAPRQ